jgi:hypothetical protein
MIPLSTLYAPRRYGPKSDIPDGEPGGRERVPQKALSPGARSVLVRIAALDPDGDGQLSQVEKDACNKLIDELIQGMVCAVLASAVPLSSSPPLRLSFRRS